MVTCIDGYQLARQGKAGKALGIAALGSFVAGTAGVVGLSFVAYPLAASRSSSARPSTSPSPCSAWCWRLTSRAARSSKG